MTAVCFEEHPLIEKTSVYLLYKAWAQKRDLVEAASQIGDEAVPYAKKPTPEALHGQVLKHFRGNLLAQLIRDSDQPSPYVGLDTFIQMSGGLPRNLLTILKIAYECALFDGYEAFGEVPLSIETQREAAEEASENFYDEAEIPGTEFGEVRQAVDRLAELFITLRYSDKPVESSCVMFTSDEAQMSEAAKRVLKLATQSSPGAAGPRITVEDCLKQVECSQYAPLAWHGTENRRFAAPATIRHASRRAQWKRSFTLAHEVRVRFPCGRQTRTPKLNCSSHPCVVVRCVVPPHLTSLFLRPLLSTTPPTGR